MDSTDTRGTTTISRATDGELFARMAERGPAGKDAWAEFYQRYVGDFRKLVCRLRGVPQAGVDELVQETMIQAYKAAQTFREVEASDSGVARRRTLAWLGRIAHNIHWSMLRQQRGVLVSSLPPQDGEDDSQLSIKGRRLSQGELHRAIKDAEGVVSGSGNNDHISLRRRLLREALDTLTDRERDILTATFEHHERGQKQQRLPNAVVKEICETYNISSAYLRQLRKRALEKIEQYADAHMPTES